MYVVSAMQTFPPTGQVYWLDLLFTDDLVAAKTTAEQRSLFYGMCKVLHTSSGFCAYFDEHDGWKLLDDLTDQHPAAVDWKESGF